VLSGISRILFKLTRVALPFGYRPESFANSRIRLVTPICPKLVEESTAIRQEEPPRNRIPRRRVIRIDEPSYSGPSRSDRSRYGQGGAERHTGCRGRCACRRHRAAKDNAVLARQVEAAGGEVKLKVSKLRTQARWPLIGTVPRALRGGRRDWDVHGWCVGWLTVPRYCGASPSTVSDLVTRKVDTQIESGRNVWAPIPISIFTGSR